MQKRWNLLESAPNDFVAECSAPDSPCGALHGVVPHLLWRRGIRSPEEISAFLEPSYDNGLHDPFLFSQMSRAVERVRAAIERGERVLVFGDYDADGVTSSAVVITTIREIAAGMGKEASLASYIPHREREGYGLIMPQAEQFAAEGYGLVITVDCGIACPNEVAFLKSHGVDVIIADHHQFGDVLPDAILIHPSLPGEPYPFKHLAAAGVAWKFACALLQDARGRGVPVAEGFEKWLLDLVAIATVADVVPLTGENRTLLAFGLRVLRKTRRPGLRALFASAGLSSSVKLGSRDIGFGVAPRLNAPSRMAHASLALNLLLAEPGAAESFARDIERLNRLRQQTTVGMMAEADRMLASADSSARARVLWNAVWPPALVGLVAGRIADRLGVPVIAIGKHEDVWIGSGRSIPPYDITAAVARTGDGLLARSGGHAQACGLSLSSEERITAFAERFIADAAERITAADAIPTLDIHAEIGLGGIGWPLIESLARLEPFGQGNPEPVFVTRDLEIVSSGVVGKDGAHLRFFCRDEHGNARPFIGFGLGLRAGNASRGSRIDIAYGVSEEMRNGERDIRCRVVDFRTSDVRRV